MASGESVAWRLPGNGNSAGSRASHVVVTNRAIRNPDEHTNFSNVQPMSVKGSADST